MKQFQHIIGLSSFFALSFFLLRVPHDVVTLECLGEPFYLRVLTNPEAQVRGFQLVEDISPNEGLAFILPKNKKVDFWMQNVVQKLDIIFIDRAGVVVKLVEGVPNNTSPIVSPDNAVCAIELPKGIAMNVQLAEGKRLSGCLFLRFKEACKRYKR